MRRTRIAAACVSVMCVLGMPRAAQAQARLELVAQDVVPGMSGLRMLTIRDARQSTCYTLFIMEPSASSASTEQAAPAPDDTAQQLVVQRIRAAAEKHERQLADLKAAFEARTGRSYEQWISQPPGPIGTIPDGLVVSRYESDRKKIDDEYEHELRTGIPGSFPPATLVPGMRTGGFEDAANATRRATLDPDTTSAVKTLTDDFARLHAELRRLAEAPRLAVSGPFTCTAGNGAPAKAR